VYILWWEVYLGKERGREMTEEKEYICKCPLCKEKFEDIRDYHKHVEECIKNTKPSES
jgi:uncharacterized C2H2 Zn-finger protein